MQNCENKLQHFCFASPDTDLIRRATAAAAATVKYGKVKSACNKTGREPPYKSAMCSRDGALMAAEFRAA